MSDSPPSTVPASDGAADCLPVALLPVEYQRAADANEHSAAKVATGADDAKHKLHALHNWYRSVLARAAAGESGKQILEDHTDYCIAIENAYGLNQAPADSQEMGVFEQKIRAAELAIMAGKAQSVWDVVLDAIWEEGVMLTKRLAAMGLGVQEGVFGPTRGCFELALLHAADNGGYTGGRKLELKEIPCCKNIEEGKNNAPNKRHDLADILHGVDLAEETVVKFVTAERRLLTSGEYDSAVMWSKINLNGVVGRAFLFMDDCIVHVDSEVISASDVATGGPGSRLLATRGGVADDGPDSRHSSYQGFRRDSDGVFLFHVVKGSDGGTEDPTSPAMTGMNNDPIGARAEAHIDAGACRSRV
jgi:hypothetical protein